MKAIARVYRNAELMGTIIAWGLIAALAGSLGMIIYCLIKLAQYC